MLKLKDIHAYYGKSHVLHGVSFDVNPGEIVALLGRNGSGRSTTAKAIMGLVHAEGGLQWKGQDILRRKAYEIAHFGIGYVPENRDIFPTLTVRENLLLGMKGPREQGRWTMRRVFELFPILEARANTPGGVLSGGEQQILSICRTLMGDPDLVMVDEPTEGLSPQLVGVMRELLESIAAQGVAILLIEQRLTIALAISHRLYVVGHGRIVFEGTPRDLRDNEGVRREWLEV